MVDLHVLADQLDMTYAAMVYRCKRKGVARVGTMIDECDVDRVVQFKKYTPHPSRFVQEYIDEVREEMNNQELKSIDMAIASDICISYFVQIMNGNRRLSIDNAQKFAEALGMKPVLCLMEEE